MEEAVTGQSQRGSAKTAPGSSGGDSGGRGSSVPIECSEERSKFESAARALQEVFSLNASPERALSVKQNRKANSKKGPRSKKQERDEMNLACASALANTLHAPKFAAVYRACSVQIEAAVTVQCLFASNGTCSGGTETAKALSAGAAVVVDGVCAPLMKVRQACQHAHAATAKVTILSFRAA